MLASIAPNLFRLATTSLPHALTILSKEQHFEQLSFDQILTILASHEEMALAYLAQQQYWPILDGLALSLIAQKSERVALYVLSQPALFEKLVGLDLARIGQASSDVAATILNDDLLCARLKSTHFAMLAENQLDTAELIFEKFFNKIDPNDLGMFCKNHFSIAKRLFNDKVYVRKCDGATLALMVEHHRELIAQLLDNDNRSEQLDSAAFVILGRHFEDVAYQIYQTSSYYRALGKLGLARMAKHHERLAHLVLDNPDVVEQFSSHCFEQIAEYHESVALRVYEHFRNKMSLDEIVMLGKYHLSIANRIIQDPEYVPLLTGKHLVTLGHHIPIAAEILANENFRKRATGHDIGLIGIKSFALANEIMQDNNLKNGLHTLDLANLCKNFFSITLLTIRSLLLKPKISSDYFDLLNRRINTIVSICSFIQNNYTQTQVPLPQLEEATAYPFVQFNVTTLRRPLVPDTDKEFVKQFQTLYL